ncbi:hypothetical protein ES703_52097 [subsurface metagenome]
MANDEAKQEVPEVEEAFTALLKKFGVGLKGAIAAETVADILLRSCQRARPLYPGHGAKPPHIGYQTVAGW